MLRARARAAQLTTLANQLIAEGAAAAETASSSRAFSSISASCNGASRFPRFGAAACAPALTRLEQAGYGGFGGSTHQQLFVPHQQLRFASTSKDNLDGDSTWKDSLQDGSSSGEEARFVQDDRLGEVTAGLYVLSAAGSASSFVDADQIAEIAAVTEADALAAAVEVSWTNVAAVEKALAYAHNTLNIPWWEAIVGVAVCVRILTLPLVVRTMKAMHKSLVAKPDWERLKAEIKEMKNRGTYSFEEHSRRISELWKKHNLNPLGMFAESFFNAMILITFYRAIMNLAEAKVPSMMAGGAAWCPDLTAADPTFALPILCGLTMLATVELGAADGMEGQDEAGRWMLRTFSFIIPAVGITQDLPAGVFVFWTASNVYSLLQTGLFKSQAVRSLLGLPPRNFSPASAAGPSMGGFSLDKLRGGVSSGVAISAPGEVASGSGGRQGAAILPVTVLSSPPDGRQKQQQRQQQKRKGGKRK